MALNGLDSSTVTDAYKSALADAGGWLLLNYTSRDEVDIFQRGNGGMAETREALSDYPNKSPLYGFLHYRGKKILLKYIPEGTSRLLQARTSVHWSSVTDAFSPHDALLQATKPDDLADAALSALCGLPPPVSASSAAPSPAPTAPSPAPAPTASPASRHVASPSPRPVASPSPRVLASPSPRPVTPQLSSLRDSPSITERSQNSRTNFYDDADDDGDGDDNSRTPRAHTRTPNAESKESIPVPSPARGGRRDYDRSRPAPAAPRDVDPLDRPRTQPQTQPRYEPRSRDARNLAAFLNDVPPPSAFASPRGEPELREFAPSPDSSGYRPSHDIEPPSTSYSSRSGRPSTSDIWRSFKPKLKLHPRPVENQGYQQPEGIRQKLPSGLKVKQRKTDKRDDRPKSRKSEKNFHGPDQVMTSANAPPRTSSRPFNAGDRRARSPEQEPPLPPLPTEVQADRRDMQSNGTPLPAPEPPASEPPLPPPPPPPVAKAEPTGTGYALGRRNVALGIDTNTAQSNRMSADTFALLSPEKQRLMKALELRKRQLIATAEARTSSDGPEHLTGPLSAAKTDSGVDIEEIRAAEAERSRPRAPPPPSLIPVPVSTPNGSPRPPQTPRRHNPALQSHPVGGVEAFASPPLQPPLPPPPRDLPPQTREHSIPRKEVPRSPLLESHTQGFEQSTERPDVPNPDDPRRRQDKRRGFVRHAPEQRSSPMSRFDNADTSDGVEQSPELMQELESATFEEAKTMPIATQQTSAGSATRSATATPVMIERTSSRRNRPPPADVAVDTPAQDAPGPPSPELHRPNTAQSSIADRSTAGKRVNVSTGISRRIHALAEMSGREGQPMPSSAAQDSTPTFLAAGTLSQPNSNSQSILARSYDESRASSPSRSMRRGMSRRQSNESQRTVDTLTGKKRDTVSITAHIQRNPQAGRPLVIEEEAYDYSPVDYVQPIHSRTVSRTSTSRTDPQRPGSSHSNQSHSNRPVSRGSTITSFTRTSLDVWKSGARRMHSRPPPSMSNVSLERVDEVSEARSSRTSKLLKRMSGFGVTKQKPPSDADSLPSMEERKMLSPPRPTSMIVGDLNVQFPDTLLWKRRWVEVDGNGNLVLSASPSQERPNGSRKKYHLSDFRSPALPGQDRQELPHSISLDFIGGGGSLQLATEDPVGQASILRRIGDAHRAWLYYET